MVKEWKRVTKVMAATWLMRGMDAQAMLAYFGDNLVEQVRSLPADEKVGHLSGAGCSGWDGREQSRARRPAAGFSLDLKILVDLLSGRAGQAAHAAVRAPWGSDPALRQAIRELRGQGHTVVCALPGHEHDVQEFDCDRELALVDGRWSVRAL